MTRNATDMPSATVCTGPLFASGYGLRETRTITLADGRANPHPTAGLNYEGISISDIGALVRTPPSVPKEQARWVIASAYRAHDARSGAVQRERGSFSMLPLDIDIGNLSLGQVDAALQAICGDVSRVIYSTKSSTAGSRKWRGLILLRWALPGGDYPEVLHAFYDLLEHTSGGALKPDPKLLNPGQIVFLPNQGSFYEHLIRNSRHVELHLDHPIMQRLAENRDRLTRATAEAKRQMAFRANRVQFEGSSVIEAFNAANPLALALEGSGYQRLADSNDFRSPMQTSRSYATRCFGDYWVSLSGSDAAAGIGKASPGGGRWGDAFDIYVHFFHGGDFNLAVRAYAHHIGMDYTSQRTNELLMALARRKRGQSVDTTPEHPEGGGDDHGPI